MMAGAKGTKRSVSRIDDSDEDGPILTKPIKKTKTTASATTASAGKDKDGNPYWELSSKRRIGISKFKDMTMINIREYYQKDDDMLPGKKGISLSLPQFEALLKAAPAISAKLRDMGHDVEDSEDAGGASTREDAPKKPRVTAPPKQKKDNFEATSDEEED
ncbi:hypothetical protein BN1708_013643 [Verticillium longisporum]|uniref:Transcriptional coactivator p15 (PC4) C-terminal domain-containing protein n=1 Tax=Verticillium longisporum TaxID=100787 RepID=A0A0G4LMJ3_VERLO|nr:hypothetical protein BN1708_013643 [Verticillium longisporum]